MLTQIRLLMPSVCKRWTCPDAIMLFKTLGRMSEEGGVVGMMGSYASPRIVLGRIAGT